MTVDLTEALYKGSSIEDIEARYIALLRQNGTTNSILHANKLEQSKVMLSNKNLLALDKVLHELKIYLRKWTKKHNVHLLIQRRKKSWIGFNQKIELYLTNNRTLDKVLDLLGIRIIICSSEQDTVDTIKLCYCLQNDIIDFFINEYHSLFLEPEPKIDINFDHSKFPNIIVPSSLLKDEYKILVKDYISNPKSNGYQSLHSVVSTVNGIIFEIQIRSFAMDILAEFGTGEHKTYKSARYSGTTIDDIDYKKIHIPGFVVLKDQTLVDNVGLVKSIDPFKLM